MFAANSGLKILDTRALTGLRDRYQEGNTEAARQR